MPKQKGTHRLLGTTGDMTYKKTKDGYAAQEKTHISKEAILTKDSYARTRENMAEFGRAGKASKVMRAAFAALIKAASDTRMTSRLTKTFVSIVKSDLVNDRGQRLVTEGDLNQLQDFDFNKESPFFSAFNAPYTATVDRVSGQCAISVQPFHPLEALTPPEGSTHLRLIAGAASIDFDAQTFVKHHVASADLPLSAVSTPLVELEPMVDPNSTQPIFLVFGVQFYQVVNGKAYALNNGASNAMALVKVDLV
jgi:hypothetical protein